MTSHMDALGHEVAQRRAALGMERKDLAQSAGLSPEIVRLIETSRRKSYSDRTYLKLDRCLGWALGSATRLAHEGTGPEVLPAESLAASRVDRMMIDVPTESYAGASIAAIDEALTAAKLAFLARMREIGAGGERPPV